MDTKTDKRMKPDEAADAPPPEQATSADAAPTSASKPSPAQEKREVGGPKGPEPTRYGDWEKGGRCVDF